MRDEAEKLTIARPRDTEQLHTWLEAVLHVEPLSVARCADHDAPLDYLSHTFFEHPGDAVVWANRGGGKTYLGAIATLLDLLFKPGIEVRILAGSREQAERMYGYLRTMLERPTLRGWLMPGATRQGLRLRNGSHVAVLSHSPASVRGEHVQRVRCDEVELFDPEIWDATQFTTRSRRCGDVFVRGGVEVMSTMHKPFGLMRQIVDQAQRPGATGFRLFRWCVLDVMDRCPPRIACFSCEIRAACGGAAKDFALGILAAEDVLSMRSRCSAQRFDEEMLCRRTSRSDSVYPAFDPAVHVREIAADDRLAWVGGMDFGIRNPTVLLWAQLRRVAVSDASAALGFTGGASSGGTRLEIMDEYIASDLELPRHLREIERRNWPRVRWLGVDPAGGQRDLHTGISSIELLRRAGYRVRSRRVPMAEGVDRVRRMMDVAAGGADASARPQLWIHPRCTQLIEALTTYHFDPERQDRQTPIKDGPDHLCDALRYLVVNLEAMGRVDVKMY